MRIDADQFWHWKLQEGVILKAEGKEQYLIWGVVKDVQFLWEMDSIMKWIILQSRLHFCEETERENIWPENSSCSHRNLVEVFPFLINELAYWKLLYQILCPTSETGKDKKLKIRSYLIYNPYSHQNQKKNLVWMKIKKKTFILSKELVFWKSKIWLTDFIKWIHFQFVILQYYRDPVKSERVCDTFETAQHAFFDSTNMCPGNFQGQNESLEHMFVFWATNSCLETTTSLVYQWHRNGYHILW